MPRLKSSNFAVTELAENISNSVTTFTVTDASSFPDSGPFVVLVHDKTPGFAGVKEIMEVGSIDKATNTFSNVLRGREGTAAVAHNAGDRVEGVWTAGTHQELADAQDIQSLEAALEEKADSSDVEALQTTVSQKADKAFSFTGTLTVAGWSGTTAPYTQSVTINGILASAPPPVIDVELSSTWSTALSEEEAWAFIKKITYTDNSLTFYADAKPTVVLNFKGVQVK